MYIVGSSAGIRHVFVISNILKRKLDLVTLMTNMKSLFIIIKKK
jgi:hypothetical protein